LPQIAGQDPNSMHHQAILSRKGIFALLILSTFMGCGQETEVAVAPPAEPSKATPPNSAPPSKTPPTQPADGPTDKPSGIEAWDIIFFEGVKAGYTRTVEQTVEQQGREFLFTQSDTHLDVQRYGEQISQDIQTKSFESLTGDVLACEVTQKLGPTTEITRGDVKATDKPQAGEPTRQMVLQIASGNKTTSATIPWPSDTRGFFAIEQSLRRQPMKPGENRTLNCFLPIFNQVAKVELVARGNEPTELLTGMADLLKIDNTTILPSGDKIAGKIWTNARGETLKTSSDVMKQVGYRTTKEIALEKSAGPLLDVTMTSVKLPQPLENAQKTKQVVYQVELTGGDPLKAFVPGPTQQLKSTGPHTAELTVRAIGPDTPLPNDIVRSAPPTDADRQPNGLIQSDDPRVTKLAAEAASNEKDPWKLAVALERFVHEKITAKNFSQAFATAADVAERLEGDCTEHAVLLAALARARGIPARVAMGLVYMPNDPGFAYHMWTEVYIKDRWIPLDATLGQGGIAADHLKLAESNLQGASAYTSFLPVAQVLGKLKINVLNAE
jgi:hypothetical protein